MKTKLILMILVCGSLTAKCQTPITGGSIYGTWTLSGSPYLVQGSIMVPNDSTLIIQPGVTINFQGHYKFLVAGRLIAIGTPTDSIIFTATNISTGWYGLRFDNTLSTNDTSKIIYCNIQWGKANGSNIDAYGGAIIFNNFSKVHLKNCTIKNNYATFGGGISFINSSPIISNNTISYNSAEYAGGIYCTNSNPLISYNFISNNSTEYGGGGILCTDNSSPAISNNFINNNSAFGGGGIYCSFDGSNPIITNNTISNNSADYNGGGIYLDAGSSSNVSNNIISYNSAYLNGGGLICFSNITSPEISNNSICNNSSGNGGGIECYPESNPIISNNVISNNSASAAGGGIDFSGTSAILTNNTIVNNLSNSKGGALSCSNGSNPTLRNCILYGDSVYQTAGEVYLQDEASDPNFYFCNVAGGNLGFDLNGNFYTGVYQNNIDSNPLFVAPSLGSGIFFNGVTANWSLQSSSPCIDAGDPAGTYPATDLAGNPRVVGSQIDIGAYEYQGTTGIANNDLKNNISIFPNPFNSFTTIQFQTQVDFIGLYIYNIYGQKIKTINNLSGNKVEIFRDNLPNGIYFIRLLQHDKVIVTGKIIISE